MADLSKIMIPNGTTYTIKDETARELADSKSEVSVSQTLSSGTAIASITVDGTSTTLYAPSGGGGGLTFDDIYPVGSVYCSDDNIDPNNAFGGTWTCEEVPYVIETGGTGVQTHWHYRKWSDGTLECWCRKEYSGVAISSTYGQLRYKVLADFSNYPVEFYHYPVLTITGMITNGNGWIVGNNSNFSTNNCGGIIVYAPANISSASITANVYAIGKWGSSGTKAKRWTRTA